MIYRTRSKIAALTAVSLMLCTAGHGQAGGEEQQLLRREREVLARVEMLKREQSILLAQKALAAADSKYLVLDLRGGKGQLKYRNRILRSFEFPGIARSASGAALSGGTVTLAGKIDGASRKRQLIFNDQLMIIRSKYMNVPKGNRKPAIHVEIPTKDLNAIFFALELGSVAIIL
jgi:hypothetical protein